MIEPCLNFLWTQTLVLAAAALVLGGTRRVLARRFGAEAAYLAWVGVPFALVAAALPHHARPASPLPAAVARLVPAWATQGGDLPQARDAGHDALLLAAWAVVAAGVAIALAWRQYRFQSALSSAGRLPAGSGPAVLGIVRPRVVLPLDFEQRFDATQRGLMLAHEGVHQRRRDNAWNLLACAVVVAHWFNPLAWLAWRWMRFDQELSCDAAVLRDAGPDPLRAYAAALLKVQGVSLPPPLATSWQSAHPLVERVRMLKLHASSSAGPRSGRRVVALAIVCAGAVSYAAQPPAPAAAGTYTTSVDDGRIDTQVTIAVDGQPPRYTVMPDGVGDLGHIRFQAQPEVGLADWLSVRVVARAIDGERVRISSEISNEATSAVLGRPVLIVRMNEPARIEMGDAVSRHVISLAYVARPSARAASR